MKKCKWVAAALAALLLAGCSGGGAPGSAASGSSPSGPAAEGNKQFLVGAVTYEVPAEWDTWTDRFGDRYHLFPLPDVGIFYTSYESYSPADLSEEEDAYRALETGVAVVMDSSENFRLLGLERGEFKEKYSYEMRFLSDVEVDATESGSGTTMIPYETYVLFFVDQNRVYKFYFSRPYGYESNMYDYIASVKESIQV